MVGPAAFPAAKLGALLLKQISKPIANTVKNQAKSSPIFRRYVCLPPARFYNWCEIKLKMWLLHFGQPVNIAVLSEEMAIDLGANLLGEGIIFLIAAGILINEYNRSSRKEAAKEEAKRQEMLELKRTLAELFMQVEEQGATIRHLARTVGDLETRGGRRNDSHNRHKHDESGPPPPPPPPPRITQSLPDLLDKSTSQSSPHNNNNNNNNNRNEMVQNGIIFRAIRDVENNFWNYPQEREDGILTLALNHLYRDVYRIPLRF